MDAAFREDALISPNGEALPERYTIDGEPLPSALRGDKNALSKTARAEVTSLTRRRPFQFLLQALLAWIVIAAAIYWAKTADSIWVSALVVIIVATRQNILGLLVHEQTHCLGFRAGVGDWVVNCIAAYPLMILSVEGYARVHLSHHKYYFSEQDPDFIRKSGAKWTFPMARSKLMKLLLSDLIGSSLWETIRGKSRGVKPTAFLRKKPTPRWLRLSYFAVAAAIITAANGWPEFLLYWFLPLATVLQVIVRVGAICEHKYGQPCAGVAESSPLIMLRWWEKLLLPNLNFHLHAYHHYFPGVAFCDLPKVHRIFEREGLVNERHVFHGYWDYLKFLTPPRPAAEVLRAPAVGWASGPSTQEMPQSGSLPVAAWCGGHESFRVR